MSWLPEDIPKSNTLPGVRYATDYWIAVNNFNNRRKVECEDLTFMIPFSADCEERLLNLLYCLPWIVFNTNAKIHIAIHEKESNFEGDGWKLFANSRVQGAADVINFIKSNPGKLSEVKASKDFLERFTGNFLLNRFPGAQPDGQKTYTRAIGKPMANAQGHSNAIVVPDYNHICLDFLKRTTITYASRGEDEPFHRTRYLNEMLDKSETKYVANHDADVILPIKNIESAMSMLRFWDGVAFVYPYDHFENGNYQVRVGDHEHVRDRIASACLSGDLTEVCLSDQCMTWSAAYGQSIFCDATFYKATGGENENFVSWGAEDAERYTRFVKSGALVARCEGGYVLHLEHPRGPDSSGHNPMFQNNEDLWEKLRSMDGPELIEYYRQCEYLKKYDWNLGEVEREGEIQ